MPCAVLCIYAADWTRAAQTMINGDQKHFLQPGSVERAYHVGNLFCCTSLAPCYLNALVHRVDSVVVCRGQVAVVNTLVYVAHLHLPLFLLLPSSEAMPCIED